MNLVVKLFCADLVVLIKNRPPLEWTKIGHNTKAIALVFWQISDFEVRLGIEQNRTHLWYSERRI